MSNLEGAILSDYLLLQCISTGGVADIYRARQHGEGNHEVAVKVFRSEYAQHETFRSYFMTEAEKIGQFEHANILPLLEFGEGEDLLYVVMPYITTGTLADLLKRVGGKLSALQALPIMQQLCSAVQYAHEHGVIHGNLKPSNIFVAADGRMLLSDFGIAQGYDDSQQTLTRMGWGSAEYAAPEQSLGVLKHSSDIYSLGVLLFRILTGRPPFTGQTPVEVLLKHVRQAPPPVQSIIPGISDAVDGVVQMALQKRANDRFVSAEELSYALFAAVTVAPVASMVARPVGIMKPQAPLALTSGVAEPRTPVPAGKQTPLPPHAQSWPRITKELSPSMSFESGYPEDVPDAHVPPRSQVNTVAANVPQQPYFESGIAIGRQHFWSAEPVEWSPIGSFQGTSTLKNEVPLNAGDYLHEGADAIATRSATSSLPQSQPAPPTAPLDLPALTPPSSPEQERTGGAESAESAFAVGLRKLLPIIIVILLLLGLLGAFFSSFFFPSGSPGGSGANVVPLHSVLATMMVGVREITIWVR